MRTHEHVAAHLDPILSDLLDDIDFAGLVDDVVAHLEGIADRLGATA